MLLGRKNVSKTHRSKPWNSGDPEKKISINVPFPEPLMRQLDFLLECRAIRSKSSFIRDAVAEAATRETERAVKIQAAIRKIDGR
jgi:Arc/MetJ-type ribon-helix-helix transcriptional regulator